MSVLVEVYSIIVRVEAVATRYPGGVRAYERDCPTHTYCSDGRLTRIGFMALSDVERYLNYLIGVGLLPSDDSALKDVAVLGQFDGLVTRCDWLDFARHPDGYSLCWISGEPPGDLAAPDGWDPSQSRSMSKPGSGDLADGKLQYLRTDGNVAVFIDRDTGEELYVGMTGPHEDVIGLDEAPEKAN